MGWLISLITGPLFSKVIGGLTDAYKLKLENATKKDKMAVDLAVMEIQGEVAARQVEASIIRAEQGWWVTALPRPIMGLAAAFYFSKVLVYDLSLGLGSTPEAQGSTQTLLIVVVTGYFGGRTIEKVARIFFKR